MLPANPKAAVSVASGRSMQLLKALFALLVLEVLCTQAALAQNRFGAEGPESEPDRMQQWLVPSPHPDVAARAVLFRPPGDGPVRLALVAPAPTQNGPRRAPKPPRGNPAPAALFGPPRVWVPVAGTP